MMRRALLWTLAIVAVAALIDACRRGGDVPGPSWRILDAGDATETVRVGPADKTEVRAWLFEESLEGWEPNPQLGVTKTDAGLTATANGPDPFLTIEGLDIPSSSVDEVFVVLTVTRFDTMPKLYWSTNEAPGFAESRSVHFTVERTSQEQKKTIRVWDHPEWRGRITGLRIDPTDIAGASVVIKEISLHAVPLERQRVSDIRIGQEWRRARLSPSGDEFEVTVPVSGPTRLELGLGVDPYCAQRHDGELRFEVDLVKPRERSLLSEAVGIASAPDAWQDRSIELDEADTSGGRVRVRFRVEATDEAADSIAGYWSSPSLVGARASEVEGERKGTEGASSARNLILISVDTLRADHVGCYGYERATSANIDRLAAAGTRFETAIAQAPETLASHMTLMTGRTPARHGVTRDLHVLGPGYTTLASSFFDRGFRTAGFTEGGYIDGHFGFYRGFEQYHDGSADPAPGGEVARTFERARRWLDRYSEEPFFLFVHGYEVHTPYAPPAEFRRFGDPEYEGPFAESFGLPGRIDTDMLLVNGDGAEERVADRAQVMALYDSEILAVDHEVGLLLEQVRSLGLDENTVIVLLADHGEEFGEHGGFGIHGHTLFDEQLLVPLIVRGPGIPSGRVVKDEVALYDILSTMGDLFSIDVPADVDGRSFAPHLEGGDEERLADRAIISEDDTAYPRLAVRSDGYKWIETRGIREWWVDFVRSAQSERLNEVLLMPDAEALYELRNDPREQANRLGDEPDTAKRLRAIADRYRPSEGSWQNPENAKILKRYGGGGQDGSVDDSLQQRLQNLGYVSGSEKTLTLEEVRKKLED